MSDSSAGGEEHIITVESTQIHRGEVPPEMAAHLTYEGSRRDILGNEFQGQGPPLEFKEETKRTYECDCGNRFRKGETAREHLEQHQDTDD